MPVGLGVDGSASNDSAHMVNEARQAMLLARVGRAMQPPEEWHNSQGERQTFLGCDLGPAEMRARDALALATHGGPQAAWTVVNGRVVVREGQLATLDLGPLLERHNRLARELAQP